MKFKFFIVLLVMTILLAFFNVSSNVNVYAAENYVVSTNGCQKGSLPKTLYLDRCSEEEVRAYYSSLNDIDTSKRSGTQVLQYLKDILVNMNYYTYAQVSDIYAITDRDWVNSPTVSTGTYNATTNTVTSFSSSKEADTNPYVIMLYVDYTIEPTTTLLNASGTANFDKEHVWCQSRGFKADSGATGPAGTDLHHLIAGDSYVNRTIHNNNPYGYVSVADATGDRDATKENKRGTQLHTSSSDEADTVFEPMDEWKGDIARAIFYMMARYNNISGTDTITEFDPNLVIVNYATGNDNSIGSSETTPATIGTLADLLAWNKLDPVSDYEIYRNDLIYRNYQGNRNPFIDYPEWIDMIWGTVDEDGTNYSSTTTGYLDPLHDELYATSTTSDFSVSSSSVTINVGDTTKISATSSSTVTWSVVDSTIASIDLTTTNSKEEVTITGLAKGTTTLNVKSVIDDKEYEKQVTITVNEKTVTPVDDDPEEIELDIPIEYIIIAVVVIVVIFIIIYACSSSKNKKKMQKAVKSTVKKATKKYKK